LILNSGRIRDQWHTMTRTGLAPRLNAHLPEPFLQIHPDDAAMRGIETGGLAKVESRWGAMLARVAVTGDVRRGTVFAPIHWNEQFASLSRVDAVINPEVDSVSGQPEFKHTPVEVRAYPANWHGFALSRQPLASVGQGVEYCVRIRGQSFWRYELAGETLPDDLPGWARILFGVKSRHPDYLEYRDDAHRRYRGVLLENNRLQACLFIGDSHRLPERAWLAGLFAKTEIDPATRLSLLAGRPGDSNLDTGRTVCSCFGVGLNTLRRAIKAKGLTTAEAVGCALKAGTNCGSCIPELKTIIAECQEVACET
jgi:assimilatory nitrate reductase catalytic subunit